MAEPNPRWTVSLISAVVVAFIVVVLIYGSRRMRFGGQPLGATSGVVPQSAVVIALVASVILLVLFVTRRH